MVNLKISPKAQKDMLEIKEYIFEELGNPTAATNLLAKITK
ncbi:type II toxin-antitoxin system RelE/ParE family toxin [Thermoanaerobacterium butyriciformans]|nr:type II toxin-antitoxin system RelE/ParE family toxin [Thermoanaerobacterium butyriciformans]MBP2070582.1 plasmid stabilization system protein ParE [Thermoanaerobacterium butyriciformans]